MGEDINRDGPVPLDAVVNEVIAEAHVRPEELRPEERAFLKQHALKKPLGVLDVWALGVGVVVAGAYFGWNLGLKNNGPVAMLVASLIVCLLYLTWVLALAELSVAMPFAGGPLAYGRRAINPLLGFVIWWLVMMETGALSAEATPEPHRTLPRGLTWAQLTLIAVVVLTWLFACGAVDSQDLAFTPGTDADGKPTEDAVDYPLAKAIRMIPAGKSPPLVY